MFEQLESRRMFAVTANVDVPSGELRIIGDTADDNVQVSKINASQIAVNDLTNAHSFTFNANQVTKVKFDGGAGKDRFEMIQGAVASRRLDLPTVALGGVGNDTMITLGGADLLDGGAGNDVLQSGNGDDSLIGGPGGAGDRDQMDAGDGSDTVDYSARAARVTVDLRNQRAEATFFQNLAFEVDNLSSVENAIGGSGPDILIGSRFDNKLFGGQGNDKLKGLDGEDRLEGAEGNDQLLGGAKADRLIGGQGNDLLSGADGGDIMSGGDGDDQLIGGTGSDQMFGGDGNDSIFAQDGAIDAVSGGNGSDTAELDGNDSAVQGDTIEELFS